MKKFLDFVVNTKIGNTIALIFLVIVIVSLIFGVIFAIPVFWMRGEFNNTWMDLVSSYLFLPFIIFGILFFIFFIPYMFYVGTSNEYTGDTRWLLKGMALFCSIIPGAFIYSFIGKSLPAIYSLLGIIICGILYLLIVKIILRKPFSIAQTYFPLC